MKKHLISIQIILSAILIAIVLNTFIISNEFRNLRKTIGFYSNSDPNFESLKLEIERNVNLSHLVEIQKEIIKELKILNEKQNKKESK